MANENVNPTPAQQPPGQAPQQQPAAQPPAQTAQPLAQAQPPAQQPPPLAPPSASLAALSAPEEIEVALPKDANVDPEEISDFKAAAKKVGLSKAQAQAMVDFSLSRREKATAKAAEINRSQWENWRKGHVAALKADPEFGADYDGNKAIAQKPLAVYGDPELARELAAMGLENHPRLTKFLHKIGKAMSEDKTPRQPPVPPGQTDENEALYIRYPSMRPTKANSE
jgi:hypothetical protein